MRSFKTKIILFFSIILLIVCGVLGSISYIKSSESIMNNVRSNLETIAKQSSKVIQARIDVQLEKLEVVATKTRISDPNNTIEDKLNVLKGEVERSGYLRIHLVDIYGHTICTNGKNYDLHDREYFKRALNGETVISDLIVSKVEDAIILAIATPIKHNGEINGVLVAIRDGDNLSKLINDITIAKSGYAYVIDDEGTIIGHKKRELVEEKYNLLDIAKKDEKYKALAQLTQKMIQRQSGTGEYYFKGQDKIMGYAPILETNWSVAVTAPVIEILSSLDIMKLDIIIAVFVVLIISIGIASLLGRQITIPIILATEHAKTMAQGDFTKDVSDLILKKKDESGQLGRAFDEMTKNFRILVSKLIESSQQVAASSEELAVTAEESVNASEEIAKTVEEIAKGATNQAIDTGVGSQKVFELGKIIEKDQEYMKELNHESNKIMDLIEEGLKCITDLAYKTDEGNYAIKEVYDNVLKTNGSAEDIGQASQVIASIAQQTNLLALNAAIEAARAGEYGRGFAVVADEIRNLSEESTRSTKVIDEAVNKLQRNSNTSVETIQKVLELISLQIESAKNAENKYSDIADAIFLSGEMVKKLNVSGEEMEQKKDALLDIIQNLSAIAQQNAASTQEGAAAAEEQTAAMNEIAHAGEGLAQLAQELQQAIFRFKI